MGHHSEMPFEKNSNYQLLPRVPLTVDLLKNLSGQDNVLVAHHVQLKLDINKYSIQNLGYLLPFLVELNISNSLLDSIRDLGTCLRNLKILRVSNCRLENLDGAMSLIGLIELEARDNYIDDLYNCAFLSKLETLDVENNNILEINNVSFLSVCGNLERLTLRDNPVAEGTKYMEEVWSRVPKLKILDDIILKDKSNTSKNEISNEIKIPKALNPNEEKAGIEKLKRKKIQRRPTLTDLLENQNSLANFWPREKFQTAFFHRRRTNSMVDEILHPIGNNDFKDDCNKLTATLSSINRKPNNLTKQNSMPDYPNWFDQNPNETKTCENQFKQQISLPALNSRPLTYNFKSNTCLVNTIEKEEINATVNITKLMSEMMKFPKPIEKGDNLE